MSADSGRLIFAKGSEGIGIYSGMANRHGLVGGATGTGKTITLRVLAEKFSDAGVPVLLTDVKGDLTGMAMPGGDNPRVLERAKALGMGDYAPAAYPVVFWDVFGEKGHPVRTTISDMGPLLLAKTLNLNDTQAGVLSVIFKMADDSGLLLLDLKDLRSVVQYAGENASSLKFAYGNISAASIGAIQRSLIVLEEGGAAKFFGEPALDLQDLMQTGPDGRGVINILSSDRLMLSPKVYAAFLLWMLSELYENLPEVGDPRKPKLVLFFDEAHLLFDDMGDALQEKIEQVVRLIRSKGVGVYFVTQNPLDVPESVLGQLGNRVQHALRAFTPRDQKAVRTAADTFRQRPGLDTEKAITELAVGEALVSVLDTSGSPTMVERAMIMPPKSRLAPLSDAELRQVMASSLIAGHYERIVDRESAYEKLRARAEQQAVEPAEVKAPAKKEPKSEAATIFGAMAKSTAHAIGSQIGRSIVRGILGSILGGGTRGRRR